MPTVPYRHRATDFDALDPAFQLSLGSNLDFVGKTRKHMKGRCWAFSVRGLACLLLGLLLSACGLLGDEPLVMGQRQMAIAEPDSDYCCETSGPRSLTSISDERIRRWSEKALEQADEDRQQHFFDPALPDLRGSITTGNTRHLSRRAVIRRHVEVVSPTPFVLMNDTWVTARAANLRSAPDSTALILSSWPKGRSFHLVGHLPGTNWYLVGEWGRLAGYINGRLLKPMAWRQNNRKGLVAAELQRSEVSDGEALAEVVFEQRCRDQRLILRQTKGRTVNRAYTACEALEGGWRITGASDG